MTDAIKNHLPLILTCGLMFLAGIGIGAAITDALNRWIQKGEKSNETQVDGKRD